MQQRFIAKTPANLNVTGTGTPLIDANLEVAQCDVTDLELITIHVNQVVDAGTVVLLVEATVDGVNWEPLGATVTEASFTGANVSVSRTLTTAYAQVRTRATALAGGGTYSMSVGGLQRHGVR